MAYAIVVCGPPQSGKSVFVQQLRDRLLATGRVAVIEGCPDGEGGWAGSTAQSTVSELRVKGKFTPQFVDWVIESIRQCPQPVALVDVGGIRSPENERIFQACQGFVVLANPAKVGEMAAWEAFGRANGCKPVALLESVLHGTTELAPDLGDGVVRGVQAALERGTRVGGPVIEAVTAKILGLAAQAGAFGPGELEANIHTGRLADQCGIETKEARLGFRPWHAPMVWSLNSDALGALMCRLWGACPAWLAAQVACLAIGQAELWDVRLGWTSLPELLVSEGSPLLNWRVEEDGDRTVVSFFIPGGVFNVAQLSELTLPVVGAGRQVVISGRGSHWLVAAIARAYARAGHSVAVLALHESDEMLPGGQTWEQAQPGNAPAVQITSLNLGEMVPVPLELIKQRS